MLRDRMENRLPKVIAPVLVVRGDRDPIVSESWAEQVARLAPQGRLIVVPGAAHTMNHYRVEQLAQLVEWFLGRKAPHGLR